MKLILISIAIYIVAAGTLLWMFCMSARRARKIDEEFEETARWWRARK